MSGLMIQEFTLADQAACLQLLRTGHDPCFSLERFEWMHLRAPLSPSRMALAWDGAQLVGCYAVIRKPLLCRGQLLLGGRDVDPVVHPAYRGRGVFQLLLRYGLEHFSDIDVFFNFANSASAPGFLKQGWQRAGVLGDRVFQVGVQGCRVKQIAARALSVAHQLRCAGLREEVNVTECRPCRFADYSHLTSPVDGQVQVIRDPAWLDWRYLGKPAQGYRFFSQTRNDQVERLYILSVESKGSDLTLCDMLEAPAAAGGSLSPLFQALRQVGMKGKVKIWDRFHPDSRRQFIKKPLTRPGGMPVFIRQGAGRAARPELLTLDNWLLTHGDLEVV